MQPYIIYNLSKREQEILFLMASALSDKEIGTRLNICEKTVSNHCKSIYAKLRAKNRLAAVVTALRAKIIKLEDIEIN